MNKAAELRTQLVEASLEWEKYLGVAPSVTSAISELDASGLVGMKEDEYRASNAGTNRTAVTRGTDFIFNGVRYQVTANRPSGKIRIGSYMGEAENRKIEAFWVGSVDLDTL
jgi:hypothetical protein